MHTCVLSIVASPSAVVDSTFSLYLLLLMYTLVFLLRFCGCCHRLLFKSVLQFHHWIKARNSLLPLESFLWFTPTCLMVRCPWPSLVPLLFQSPSKSSALFRLRNRYVGWFILRILRWEQLTCSWSHCFVHVSADVLICDCLLQVKLLLLILLWTYSSFKREEFGGLAASGDLREQVVHAQTKRCCCFGCYFCGNNLVFCNAIPIDETN